MVVLEVGRGGGREGGREKQVSVLLPGKRSHEAHESDCNLPNKSD